MEMDRFELVLLFAYRMGLVGFLIGGGWGVVANGDGIGDTPALVVAAQAVASGFFFGALAVVAGIVTGLVMTRSQSADERHATKVA